MKRLSTLALVFAVVATTLVFGQRGQRGQKGGFGGGGMGGGVGFLIGQKSVQDELKLSEEQIKKVGELSAKQREARGEIGKLAEDERRQKFEEMAKANEKAVAEILTPEQLKRVKQISYQQQGARALGNAEVAEALKLSAEQKDNVKTILDDNRKEMEGLFGGGGGGNRDEIRKKVQDLQKTADEKLSAVLKTEQKTKWQEMKGEPFKGEIQRFGPGGGGGKGKGKGNRPKGGQV